MRVRPESITHLVVKLFNVKSKFDYAVGNRRTYRRYRTIEKKLTRSDLNFFASDPMSGAIFQ
jgi:hypothetical protein